MKSMIIICAIIAMTVIGVSISEGGVYSAYYMNGDDTVILSASDWDYWNHVVINYNNQDYTGSAIVLDPNGVPSNAYGFYYFWGDFYCPYWDFYGSNDGVNWTHIATYLCD